MHRLGQPSEIGKTARFLLSTDASFITKANMNSPRSRELLGLKIN